MTIASTDPATGRTWQTYDALRPEEVERRLARAAAAWETYRTTSLERRAAWLLAAARLLEERAGELAALAAREMGKPVSAGRAEVLKCARASRYYAANAARMLEPVPADAAAVGASEAYVRYEPLGPVLAVMPWNYPFWQVVRFAAPALMAGNVVLLKHASNVPACALALEEVFRAAGFPEAAFQTLLIGSRAVEEVVRDRRVAAVTLTGSEGAGRAVAAAAGRAIKKTVLELGGSDPFVVMPSADVGEAARVAAASRFQNAGQSCIAAKRFIVHRDCHGEFTRAFREHAEALTPGDPMREDTALGPLATRRALDDLQALVDDAAAKGARVLCGGKPGPGPGWYYPPTVIDGVTEEMRLWSEEAFGPVAAVIEVAGLDEAIEVANATDLGLSSNAWTGSQEEAGRLVAELRAGAVFVNGMSASYPELPFGGVKDSGYGRELSDLGLREFCNAKTVWKG
ncbi:succinate-semialdehyde dehydrogenase/glutarate-semialdehyde dehydrogenase [Thermocatellispora tengchongensis]|uniref:Succinate-semialdehyde dehydrogenase/glutarate-semialdehyde dehydrogenase n=1 Tax=Thermocatellispora tengchongensis TaxID=1073253 RepID=A0A840PJ68_9ACTN|nr:aldehyde dehydrogenase family protein [Thermocatellispora tengchongensis]MBB5137861.1 succinate-semialdehyde dehydrogenase/glutarate-semialdehyde dehydrogenase [Thermocatellispora tengchongensis]